MNWNDTSEVITFLIVCFCVGGIAGLGTGVVLIYGLGFSQWIGLPVAWLATYPAYLFVRWIFDDFWED